jgi:hypothetical protein
MMELNQLIDFCLGSKGSPFDVAQVAHRVLKDRFRYKGEQVWEYWDTEWKVDENRHALDMAIKVDVCQVFMGRAMYWQEQSMCENISTRIDCQLRSHKLLELCLKLGKDRFVKDVIKEARSFFSVD